VAAVTLTSVGGQLRGPAGSAISKTSGAGTAFTVSNSASGTTVAYAGTLNVTSGAGVSLSNNTGSTITFSGGVTLSTGTNAAFTATGGGTVNVTGTTNTLTTTTGTALNVANTTVGAGGLTFKSISANGAATGIVLNGNLGGAVTVTGDGSGFANGSGGSILNATTRAAHLVTMSGTVSFNSMNFALNTSAVGGILFDNNSGGTVSANFTGCTFTGVTASASQEKSLLQFEGGNTGVNKATITANVQNSFFNSSRTYGFFAEGAGDSVVNVTVNQSGFGTNVNTGAPVNKPGTTITNPPPFALAVAGGSNSKVDYTISNNTFWGADGLLGAVYAVTISGASGIATSHLNGSITNNQLGKAGSAGSGCAHHCAGIGLLPGTAGTFNATVTNNDIRQVNATGIDFFNSAGAATAVASLKVKGNMLAEPDTTDSPTFQRAVAVSPGNSAIANSPWCAEIGDNTGSVASDKNTITGAWQAGSFIRVTNNNNLAALTLPGLVPTTGATAAQVNAFVQAANTLAANSVNTSVGTAGIKGSPPASCF
jgi:hypothetical protein